MVTAIWKGSPNFYPQQGVKKLFITLHWMVGTLDSTDRVFASSTRKASATYGVGQSEIHQYVQEKDYPFSDGNTYANQHTISIEHEGGYLLADGSRAVPTPAVLELSAQLCADISRHQGFGLLELGRNVFPHSHWVATACPGSLDMAKIVARANELLGGSAPASLPTGAAPTIGWNTSSWSTAQIQAALIQLGYNLGPTGADDDYGKFTTDAVHQFEVNEKLSVDIGIAGPEVVGRLAQLLGTVAPPKSTAPVAPPFPLPSGWYFGPKSGPRESVSGYFSYRDQLRRWQQRMSDRGWIITVDGLYGDQTGDVSEAFQKEKHLTVDRLIGPQTWAAAWTEPVT